MMSFWVIIRTLSNYNTIFKQQPSLLYCSIIPLHIPEHLERLFFSTRYSVSTVSPLLDASRTTPTNRFRDHIGTMNRFTAHTRPNSRSEFITARHALLTIVTTFLLLLLVLLCPMTTRYGLQGTASTTFVQQPDISLGIYDHKSVIDGEAPSAIATPNWEEFLSVQWLHTHVPWGENWLKINKVEDGKRLESARPHSMLHKRVYSDESRNGTVPYPESCYDVGRCAAFFALFQFWYPGCEFIVETCTGDFCDVDDPDCDDGADCDENDDECWQAYAKRWYQISDLERRVQFPESSKRRVRRGDITPPPRHRPSPKVHGHLDEQHGFVETLSVNAQVRSLDAHCSKAALQRYLGGGQLDCSDYHSTHSGEGITAPSTVNSACHEIPMAVPRPISAESKRDIKDTATQLNPDFAPRPHKPIVPPNLKRLSREFWVVRGPTTLHRSEPSLSASRAIEEADPAPNHYVCDVYDQWKGSCIIGHYQWDRYAARPSELEGMPESPNHFVCDVYGENDICIFGLYEWDRFGARRSGLSELDATTGDLPQPPNHFVCDMYGENDVCTYGHYEWDRYAGRRAEGHESEHLPLAPPISQRCEASSQDIRCRNFEPEVLERGTDGNEHNGPSLGNPGGRRPSEVVLAAFNTILKARSYIGQCDANGEFLYCLFLNISKTS